MVWFKGSVAEAVKLVSERNLILLVYIDDDSEKSTTLDKQFNDEKVVDAIKQKAIALKMKHNSNDAAMFGQLYPISQVPVVYFILQGTIKDAGLAELTSQEILHKINAISTKTSTTVDIKEKLAQARTKKAEEDQKKAREQEMNRRQEGKLAQDTHSKLEEQQNKMYLERMKKEKKEQEQYKKKIKEQIAKDRASMKVVRPKETNTQNSTSSDHCKLNIKQLDGSSLKHYFSPSDTLASVSNWIDTARTDGDDPFKLFAQFPNRNFDIVDEQRTLLELKLCPSATLIMKPVKNVTTAYGGNSTSSSWFDYLHSVGNSVYSSVVDVGSSVSSYLVSPTTLPEPGQRLGGSRNINTSSDSKDDDKRQTYNGNSVNHE